MLTWLWVSVTLTLAAGSLGSETSPLEYRAIAVVIRHGDRNGIAQFPDVPNDWHFIKTGDLTPKGCMKEYRNGILVRTMMPDVSRRSSTVLQSASAPSPLVVDSLACFMAGLNGPSKSLNDSHHDPAVHTAETKEEDILLNFGRVSCPIRDEATQKDPSFLQLYEKYKNLIDRLNNGTGEKLGEKDLMTIIKGRLEPIIVANEVGVKVPDWVNEEFLDQAERLADEEFAFVVRHRFQRALSGVFLRKLIDDFEKSPKDSVSFFGYGSVHTTMGPLMKTIGLWTGLRPAYGEAFIFTLGIDDRFRIFHLSSNSVVKEHTPAGCSKNHCTLGKFEKAMNGFLKLDWKQECNQPYSPSSLLSDSDSDSD